MVLLAVMFTRLHIVLLVFTNALALPYNMQPNHTFVRVDPSRITVKVADMCILSCGSC